MLGKKSRHFEGKIMTTHYPVFQPKICSYKCVMLLIHLEALSTSQMYLTTNLKETFTSCHLSCDHLSLSLALMRSCLSVHFLARSQHSIQQKLQIKHLYVLTKTNLAD